MLDDDTGFKMVIGLQLGFILFVLAGAIAGAVVAWLHFPVTGGEWWPLVRLVVSLIGGVLGAKVAGILAYVLAAAGLLGFLRSI